MATKTYSPSVESMENRIRVLKAFFRGTSGSSGQIQNDISGLEGIVHQLDMLAEHIYEVRGGIQERGSGYSAVDGLFTSSEDLNAPADLDQVQPKSPPQEGAFIDRSTEERTQTSAGGSDFDSPMGPNPATRAARLKHLLDLHMINPKKMSVEELQAALASIRALTPKIEGGSVPAEIVIRRMRDEK